MSSPSTDRCNGYHPPANAGAAPTVAGPAPSPPAMPDVDASKAPENIKHSNARQPFCLQCVHLEEVSWWPYWKVPARQNRACTSGTSMALYVRPRHDVSSRCYTAGTLCTLGCCAHHCQCDLRGCQQRVFNRKLQSTTDHLMQHAAALRNGRSAA